jgi:hypothetical protein
MTAEISTELPNAAPRKRPPRFLVISDPPPEEIGAEIDWSDWYLTWEEDMGQPPEQHDTREIFESSLSILAQERRWQNVRVSSDEFFAWVEREPLVRVSPDAFILDNPPPPPYPGMWETWRPGIHPPRFALEVVSDDRKKDYDLNPPKYAQLGTSELVIFDPVVARGAVNSSRRVALQVYHREEDGSFVRVYAGVGPVWSEELEIWLVVQHLEPQAFLRMSHDSEGREIVPTVDEARRQEQAAREVAERQITREQTAREVVERQRADLERQLAEAHAALEELRKNQ